MNLQAIKRERTLACRRECLSIFIALHLDVIDCCMNKLSFGRFAQIEAMTNFMAVES